TVAPPDMSTAPPSFAAEFPESVELTTEAPAELPTEMAPPPPKGTFDATFPESAESMTLSLAALPPVQIAPPSRAWLPDRVERTMVRAPAAFIAPPQTSTAVMQPFRRMTSFSVSAPAESTKKIPKSGLAPPGHAKLGSRWIVWSLPLIVIGLVTAGVPALA